MKLTTLILIISLMQVSAASFGQRLTLIGNNVKLERVFNEIQKQTGYGVLVSTSKVDTEKGVKVNFRNTALTDVMDQLTKGSDLAYTIEDNVIVIKEKTPSILDRVIARFQAIDVRGKVVDTLGNGLPGATVSVKNGKGSTSTDAGGNFQLKNVDEGAVLVVSYLGYVTREVVSIRELMIVRLITSESKLDEIQIIAYGRTNRRLSTGNISTVKAADIQKQPVSNPLLALQGRVPGLQITQQTGLPGSGIQVLIQGQNSLGNGNDPYYVVDGVPFSSQLLPNYGVMLGRSESAGFSPGANNGNPLNFINPTDIESVDVLKDADATAIYGSRAANGAILITTKKGGAGKTNVSVEVTSGWGKVASKMATITPGQYLEMRTEAYKNDGLPVPDSKVPNNQKNALNYDLTLWDTNNAKDWQRELIGKLASFNNIRSSISGGSANTSILVSVGYSQQGTVFPGDFDNKKINTHVNLSNVSENKRLRFQFSTSYQNDHNTLPNHDLTYEALYLSPFAPDLRNPDGSLNWSPDALGVSTWQNPLSYLYQTYRNRTANLIGNTILSYQIINGLEVKSTFGYNRLDADDVHISPLNSVKPENRPNEFRIGEYSDGRIESWILEPQASYSSQLGAGRLEILTGTTFQKTTKTGKQEFGYGYNSDSVIEDIMSAPFTGVNSTTNSLYNYSALFGRISYNVADKYIVNFTGRRDGSSRFGARNKFHNFGAVGFAWLFSNEELLTRIVPILSFGKLRLSYGTTGNDQITDYRYLSLYTPVAPEVPYQGINGLEVLGLSNPVLQWEETKKFQTGLDIGLFKDRILFNLTYYRNRSSNQLIGYALPPSTGFGSVDRNFPALVQNSGIELSITTANIKTNLFNWSTILNLTTPKNKLLDFPDIELSNYSLLEIGKPVFRTRVYQFHGINPVSGLFEFVKADGTISSTPDPSVDKTMYVDLSPKYYGGLQNSISFKEFSFDFLLQFVKQIGANYAFGRRPGRFAGGFGNQPIYVLDRWRQSGDTGADNQRFSYNKYNNEFNNAALYSDAGFTDASFIRLKNVSLSWNTPTKVAQKIGARNIRAYLQGQNLMTFTSYMGLDPENKTTSVLPPLKVFTIGFNATF